MITAATMDEHSDSSSILSALSRSPSPPSELNPHRILTPPSSQLSTRTSPGPDASSSGDASSGEDSEGRPAKRRKLSGNMPRETRRLNLGSVETAENHEDLDRLVKALRTKRKIVVVAGAGISVSAGIPDFRSDTGLFRTLKAEHKLKGSGKQLFDAAVYRDSNSTSSFHAMVRSLSEISKTARPTRFHHLLARLAQEGRLLRLYSQNVDGIDTSMPPLATQVPLPRKAPWPNTVQLHGGLTTMVCTKCSQLSDIEADLFDGPIPPECDQCKALDYTRTEVAGKRSHGIGKLRPRMVLYNEPNPDDEAIGSCAKADLRRRPDCIIVVGTSLKVPGVRRIVREMCGVVRDHRDGLSVWINNDPEPAAKEFENCWDIIVQGASDQVADHVNLRHWDDATVGDLTTVTEEEVRQIKERSKPSVLVVSPSKPIRTLDINALPTPANSPRPVTRDGSPTPQSFSIRKLTLTNLAKPPTANPASKGKPLTEVLQRGAGKPGLKRAAAKGAATATGTAPAAKPKKAAAKKAPANAKQGEIGFAVGKPKAAPATKSKIKLEAAPETKVKAEPAALAAAAA